MIARLYLENFKAFDKLDVQLAPLTFIYGPNSIGKSSILQAILVLAQSLEDAGDGTGFIPRLLPEGPRVSLGSFRNIVHGQTEKPLVIGITGPSGYDVRYEFHGTDEQNGALAAVRLRPGPAVDPTVAEDTLTLLKPIDGGDDYWELDSEQTINLLGTAADQVGQAWIREVLWAALSEKGSVRLALSPARSLQLFVGSAQITSLHEYEDALRLDARWASHQSDSAEDGTSSASWVDAVGRLLERRVYYPLRDVAAALDDVRHIGAHRSPGARLYFDRSRSDSAGSQGQRLANLLYSRPDVLRRVNDHLRDMEVGYSVSLRPCVLRESLVGYRISLQPTTGDISLDLDLPDLGFGISQLLPMLAEHVVLAEKDRQDNHGRAPTGLLLVEQPELHLNPSWQASLTSVILGAFPDARSESDTGKVEALLRGPQVVMETHSELAMLRAMKLVRHGVVPSTAVTSIVLSRESNEPSTFGETIALDEAGRFDTLWPDGFFAQRAIEEDW